MKMTSQARRAAFKRGTEALNAEQCREYAARMAWVEHIGSWSRAAHEMAHAQHLADRRADENARRVAAHKAAHPDTYAQAGDERRASIAQGADESDRTRVKARETMSADRLPTYGIDRPVTRETTRRYDLDDRTSSGLEREADRILRAAGFDVHRVDVVDQWTRMPEVAPDSVAFRGVARRRVADPRPVATGKVRTCDGAPMVRIVSSVRSERAVGTRTVMVWHPQAAGMLDMLPRIVLARTQITRADGTRVVYIGCAGDGYSGRKLVMPITRGTRATLGATARPGRRTMTAWGMSPTSVRTAWRKADQATRDHAQTLAARLLADDTLHLASGATIETWADGSTGRHARVMIRRHADDTRPVVMPETEALRRAALDMARG